MILNARGTQMDHQITHTHNTPPPQPHPQPTTHNAQRTTHTHSHHATPTHTRTSLSLLSSLLPPLLGRSSSSTSPLLLSAPLLLISAPLPSIPARFTTPPLACASKFLASRQEHQVELELCQCFNFPRFVLSVFHHSSKRTCVPNGFADVCFLRDQLPQI